MNNSTTAIILFVLVLAAASACAATQKGEDRPPSKDTTDAQKIQSGGRTRTFDVHLPKTYDGKTAVPLVVSLHGRHGQGKDQAKLTGFDEVADRHGFIVVYPDGVGKSWNALHGTGEAEELGVDDVAFIGDLIDDLSKRYRIDPRRIYATGMSNGGAFAHRLGCELSGRLAAIATVAGQMAPRLAKQCEPAVPVAVIDFHGTRDRIVSYDGGETGGGGDLLSAPDTVEVWRTLNGCDDSSKETFSKGKLSCRSFTDCRAPVVLCTAEGAGHTWPGGYQYLPRILVGRTNQDAEASEMIWQFFVDNPKPELVRKQPGRTTPVERRKKPE